MLLLRRQIALQAPRNVRFLSGVAESSSSLASKSTPPPPHTTPSTPSSPPAKSSLTQAKLSYFVPRNNNGNLSVYTDVRNGGSRHIVLIRNVEGNISALGKDLSETLFEPETYEASRIKIEYRQSKHVLITGGRWKDEVLLWLKNKGF